jgi:hypothetical protein
VADNRSNKVLLSTRELDDMEWVADHLLILPHLYTFGYELKALDLHDKPTRPCVRNGPAALETLSVVLTYIPQFSVLVDLFLFAKLEQVL